MNVLRLLPLIGIALFLYISGNMNLSEVAIILQNANYVFLLGGIAMIAPIIAIKAWKWQLLMKSCNVDYPLIKSIHAWTIGYSVGIVTPGRVGDFSRAYYLKGRMSLGRSLTTITIDRVIDVLVLFAMSITGILLFATLSSFMEMVVSLTLVFIAFLVVVYLFSRKGLMKSVLRPLFRRMIPERHKSRISAVFEDFYRGLGIMKRGRGLVIYSTIMALVAMILTVGQYYLMTMALNIGVSFQFLLMVMPVVMIIEALPISFSGLGTRDAALIFFFSLIGLAAEPAVSFSLIILIIDYLLMGMIGAALFIRTPIKIRKF